MSIVAPSAAADGSPLMMFSSTILSLAPGSVVPVLMPASTPFVALGYRDSRLGVHLPVGGESLREVHRADKNRPTEPSTGG